MAIPKRLARKIVVDGRTYDWCSTQRGAASDLTITVQPESGVGCVLLVKAQHMDRYDRLSSETGSLAAEQPLPPDAIAAVTPALVREGILCGRSLGWDSTENDRPLTLRYQGGAFHRE